MKDPSNLRVYSELDKSKFDGLGFVIPLDYYAVVDLDDCFDEDGNLKPAPQTIVDKLRSYTEYSPSGTGVHVIVRAALRGYTNLDFDQDGQSIEIKTPGNFVTFTGNSIMDFPIADRTSTLEAWYKNAGKIKKVQDSINPRLSGQGANEDQHFCNYGKTCLANAVSDIRKAKPGSRTQTLISRSFKIGRVINHIDEITASRELELAGISTGLSPEKCRKTVSEGIKDGKQHQLIVKCSHYKTKFILRPM